LKASLDVQIARSKDHRAQLWANVRVLKKGRRAVLRMWGVSRQ